MKFIYQLCSSFLIFNFFSYSFPLFEACRNGNLEIVQLLLDTKKLRKLSQQEFQKINDSSKQLIPAQLMNQIKKLRK